MVFGFGRPQANAKSTSALDRATQMLPLVQRTIAENALALDRLRRSLPRPTPQDHLDLARAPKRGSPFRKGDGKIGPVDVGNAMGKVWNAPNTAVGLAYGSVGHAVGHAIHDVYPKYPTPRIVFGDNAVQFRDNPFGGVSAITIGNASTYRPGEDTPGNIRHETQHTYQGEKLGPAYLPSNLVGGLTGLMFDRDKGLPDWHGQHNWNERGPLSDPPVPWAPREPR